MQKTKIDPIRYRSVAAGNLYPLVEKELHEFLRERLNATCYVSCSFGKDSSVIAHAAHAIRPGIPILVVDPGCPTHWLERERDMWVRYADKQGWNLRLFPWDKWECVDGEKDVEAATRKIHDNMFAGLQAYTDANGLRTRILGMRAAESRGRRLSVFQHGRDYVDKNGDRRLLPIGRWSTDFVWAYIVKHGLPWLEIYDHAGPDARNGLVGVHGANNGRMAYLKRYFPEAWRFARQVLPDAETAAY